MSRKVPVTQESIAKLSKDIAEAITTKAAVRALNKTVTSLRAEAKRQIKARIGLSFSREDANKRFEIAKAAPARLTAKLTISGRGVPLVRFKAVRETVSTSRGRRYGVSVEIKGKRQLWPGGFLATTRHGYKGVFERKNPADPKSRIKQSLYNAVTELFARTDIRGNLQRYGVAALKKNIAHESAYALQKELSR